MIHGILSVQLMCLAVFFHNLQVFFSLPLGLVPSTSYSIHFQGAYNSGKPENLREFVNSGKLWENSGNLKFTQEIYQMLAFIMTQSETHKNMT